MERSDVLKLMAVLRGAYPQFYRGISRQEAEDTVNLWAEMFAHDDASLVAAAIKALIASDDKGFPPHIGAVKARIRQITQPVELTEAEAWALAARAVRRTDWNHPEKQFNMLPPDVQAAIGSPQTLIEWGKAPEETLGTVVAAGFKRAYRARRQESREYESLPPDVKVLICSMGKQFALEEPG